MSSPKILILAGPTASGKTDVAIEISKKLPVEAVSFDSMQVYRSMPVTTQAPPHVTRKLTTHLVSFLNPRSEYSAAHFRWDALKLIPKIFAKKKVPLLVGGTGLYLRALLDGLFEADGKKPAKNEALRMKLAGEQEARGGSYLHDQLRKVDEVSARRIHPNDLRRIIRALEVHHLTGQPMSAQIANREGIRNLYDSRIFFLDRVREDLYARINRRVDRMIQQGLVQEIQKLVKQKLSLTAQMALGVREIQAYLDGRSSLEEAVALLKKNTRHYAKRQISWFRHENGVEFISVSRDEKAADIAKKILSKWHT